MEADFSGYATKAGLTCSDGRVIMKDAFAHQDKKRVPLVWAHSHDEPTNVLGHAILENREDGVYAYGFFNDTPSGQHAKSLVKHGDIVALSIYANQLKEQTKRVVHGMIRELSLVMAGANPGALIDNVNIAHSDGSLDTLEDEAVIYSGVELEHSDLKATEEQSTEAEVTHEDSTSSDPTVQEVYDTLSDQQKDVVNYMIGAALEAQQASAADSAQTDGNAQHSDESEGTTSDDKTNNEDSLTHQEGSDNTMPRNVFDQTEAAEGGRRVPTLTHEAYAELIADARQRNSFKDALKELIAHSELAHATDSNGNTVTYGIADIDFLFPEAKLDSTGLQIHSRRMEWVKTVLDSTKKLPFSKVRTLIADITADEARAKGYVKGTRKVEEVITLLRRSTGPATIYKKQKLDRDDIIDIGNDMDIVAWLKVEIRLMLEEELARAILVGDGRSNLNEDKIKDPAGAQDGNGIRSILHDDDFYSIKARLDANVSAKDMVKGLVRQRAKYRGSGKPTLYIADEVLTDIMLEEDKFGRALYETEQALADKLRVDKIVTVDVFSEYQDLMAIMVNLADYSIGTNRGGELTSFEDFDIDFNQHKYLQETRLSGGLNKPLSAVVVLRSTGTLVAPTAPSFDGATNTVTIPTVTGVAYEGNDVPLTAGDHVLTETTEVVAMPEEGYYFAPNTTQSWTYTV